ncbi:MAG: hypothetical protein K940chlam7_01106 [Chlamydiae bacterium]|nr:hypothetical protein [Chlamydiota bacterium]
MFEKFALFQSHIDLAHNHWKTLVKTGDTVIDATCGNGHDTLVLATLALSATSGTLYALDVQSAAIDSSKQHLQENLPQDVFNRIHFVERCHSQFPPEISHHSVMLIAYNLGYLPGGDKTETTTAETTIASLQKAQQLIKDGGVICITCYPGHAAGKEEEKRVLAFMKTLEPKQWSCSHHCWTNRNNAPSLVLVQKNIPTAFR